MSRVVVIGGGLHGCSAALHLARAGASVTVLEKDSVGAHASGLNAGGVRRLGRHPAEIPLSVAASKIWPGIEDLVGDDCGFVAGSQVLVAETESALQVLRSRLEHLAGLGWHHEKLVDRDELRARLPGIGDQCLGALVVDGDGAADPPGTARAFGRACTAAGVQVVENCAVQRAWQNGKNWIIETAGRQYEADWLINAAGAWAGQFAAMMDEPVPMRAAAFMMTRTEPMPRFLDAVIGIQGRPLSLKQMPDGSLWIGGGMEGTADLHSGQCTLDDEGLQTNLETAIDIFAQIRQARVARVWAGIEGVMPDGIPVIDISHKQPQAVHVFGFSGHGFQLAPAVGQVVADLVVSAKSSLPIQPFSIARFS